MMSLILVRGVEIRSSCQKLKKPKREARELSNLDLYKMSELVVRVYSRSGRSRFTFSNDANFQDLATAIQERLHVEPNNQRLSLDEGGNRTIPARGNAKLSSLGIEQLKYRNGTIVYLLAEAQVPTAHVNQSFEPELPELASQLSGKETKQEEYENQHIRNCRHGPGQKCINCLAKEKAERKDQEPVREDHTWRCNHPKEQRCINCLEDNFVAGIKHKSFESYLRDRRSKCNHSPDTTCTNCVPPAALNYKLKQNCPKHKPYPEGVCNSCMPDTASLQRQPYRHIDYVELMNKPEIENFVAHWQSHHFMQQRAAFLYGYYAEDPNYPDGVRAVVEALYEPTQIGDVNGFQIIEDPYMTIADMVAGALGFEKVGWLFTTINHDTYLSSHEIRTAAKYQQEHITMHQSGYPVSKFVTVVLKPKDDGSCEPQAFMISDQGQALERDCIFGDSDSRRRLRKRTAAAHELLPTIMAENQPSEEFAPEWFIVNLGCGMPVRPMNILKNYDFPISNRDKEITVNDVKSYMNKHKNQPGHVKYSSFQLLYSLAKILDVETAMVVAQAVANEAPVPHGVEDLVSSLRG